MRLTLAARKAAHRGRRPTKLTHHKVRIHIDQRAHESPNPTTGEALYVLGHVQPSLELYREVGGNREDKPVGRGPGFVHLHEDEHFHSGPPPAKHEITIIVNGTPHRWAKDTITYAEVVTLDVPDYPKNPGINYSVKYKNGPHQKPEGTLSPGGEVKVRDREVFSVSPTGQS